MDIIKNNITKILNNYNIYYRYYTYYTYNINNYWKSFGNNMIGHCGVGNNEIRVIKPTTFYEGEIFEWKNNYDMVFVRLKNNVWKSFGNNKYGHCGIGSDKKIINKPIIVTDQKTLNYLEK